MRPARGTAPAAAHPAAPCSAWDLRQDLAAVDHQALPGDERRQIGGQVQHGAAHVPGLTEPLERDQRLHASMASAPRPASPSVRMLPGATALTVIPNGATSIAALRMNPSIPAFDAP